ncbi:MAG: hypothetical protein ACE5KH_03920 [Candidatus Geothermarchaeales archaeon]
MELAKKLQIKEGQEIRVVGGPTELSLDLPTTERTDADAILLFVRDRGELEAQGQPFVEAASSDKLAWLAYPKGGQLGTDLSRDRLWAILKPHGIRPVRQVSLDAVWSAMRFRPQ